MKSVWSHCLQMSVCAAAVCALGAVNAQTPPPASVQPAPAVTSAPPAPAQAKDGKKQQQHHHRAHKGEQRHSHKGEPAASHKHEHEAEHGPADGHWKEHAGPHAGDIGYGDNLDQYQRNALARCNVFRDSDDRRSCVERVRAAPTSGSVKDGGVLREFTEQVPVKP